MKAIHQAIRTFLAAHKGVSGLGLAQTVMQEVRQFERRNRGHRNLLDAPVLSPISSSPDISPNNPRETVTRRYTLGSTTRKLVAALMPALQLEDFPFNQPSWDMVLRIGDTSGWLARALCSEVSRVLDEASVDVPGISFTNRRCYLRPPTLHSSARLEISVDVAWGHLPLSARRTWDIPVPNALPFGQCLAICHNTSQALRKGLSHFETWPEFSKDRQAKQLPVDIRKKFEKLLKDFSPAERQLLGETWATLKPPCLNPVPAKSSIPVNEMLFSDMDSGWGKPMPVTLITYDDGRQDLHRQTGPEYHQAIDKAMSLLKERGLRLAASDNDAFAWPSGMYLTVEPIPGTPSV
jgi:hypothetical protein